MTEAGEKKVLIAVIDSGIETSVSDLKQFVIKSTGYRVNSDGIISEYPDIRPNGKHGTIIALIIRNISRHVRMISLNILNERLATDSRIMIHAMNEALMLKPDIIHMSIGTVKKQYRNYVKDIVDMANEENIIIVAACNNFGFWSLPAYIDGVIGVKSARNHPCNDCFYKNRRFYFASSKISGIEAINELNNNNMRGTSVAAAFITGHIANIIETEKSINKQEILRRLNSKIKLK